MTTPDGHEPPAEQPTWAAPPPPVYPPGYEPAGYPPGYEPTGYPPGYEAAGYPPGYEPAGYPPGYPAAYPPIPRGYQGYIASDYLGGPVMYAVDPNDPLVTAPGQRFAGWWARLMRVFADNWRALLPVYLIGYLAPLVLTAAAGVSIGAFGTFTPTDSRSTVTGGDLAALFGSLAGVLVVSLVVSGYLSAVAWAATAWTITRRAAGQPATVGGSLAYGFRRSLPLFGWSVLIGFMVALGALACVLPGIYLAIATSLAIPIAIYAGAGPIGGSFSLVHRFFGPVLGRIALLLAIQFAIGVIGVIIQVFFRDPTGVTSVPVSVIVAIITGLLAVPGQMLFKIGSILTWAEMTAQTTPISTATMDAAL